MKRGAEKQLTKDDDASDEEVDVSCNISLFRTAFTRALVRKYHQRSREQTTIPWRQEGQYILIRRETHILTVGHRIRGLPKRASTTTTNGNSAPEVRVTL